MNLKTQKRLAASILDCSEKRVHFDPDRLTDIKEAITKFDIQNLIRENVITRVPMKSISRVRARKIQVQKRKGRRKGMGNRKGNKTARAPRKQTWINKIRSQRELLKKMRENKLISTTDFRSLYQKAKGGFFRSKRHIKLYIDEHKIIKK